MSTGTIVNRRGEVIIPDPPMARTLFSSTRFAWLWLIVRVYVGYNRLTAGSEKLSGGKSASRDTHKGFWTKALAQDN
jgi:thiosulfate dehydrogenase [quinone] large subunit